MAFPKRILSLFLARVFVAMLKVSVMNFEREGELTLFLFSFYFGYIMPLISSLLLLLHLVMDPDCCVVAAQFLVFSVDAH
jgi:hypothetical protein